MKLKDIIIRVGVDEKGFPFNILHERLFAAGKGAP